MHWIHYLQNKLFSLNFLTRVVTILLVLRRLASIVVFLDRVKVNEPIGPKFGIDWCGPKKQLAVKLRTRVSSVSFSLSESEGLELNVVAL